MRPARAYGPPFVLRPAHEDDIPALVQAFEWLFAPPGVRPRTWDERDAAEALGRVLASPRSAVLVAASDGVLVGFCTVYRDIESVRYGPRAWVEDLATHPAYRSQGIGKRLLDRAKEWAREAGASHLELESSEARGRAHRFYERERPTWRTKCFNWVLSSEPGTFPT